jgi:glutaminase
VGAPGHSYIYAGHRTRSPRNAPGLFLLGSALLWLASSSTTLARGPLGAREADYQLAISQAYQRYQSDTTGKIAEPIAGLPALATHYAVVIVRVDGKIWEQGDARVPFVLAAMAAPFTAALAAEQRGPELLNSTAGAVAGTAPVPPGRTVADWGPAPNMAFGAEGSIATLGLVQPQHDADAKWRALMQNFNRFAGAELSVNDRAYHGEPPLAARVPQLTRELASDGRLQDDVDPTADLYLRQSAVSVTARDLAIMAATLANDGVNPVDRKMVVKPEVAQAIQSQLLAPRKGSSTWMSKAGIAASAGISGGIFVVVPGRLGIAVYAPPLDASGVSMRGQKAIKYLSQALMFP